MIQNLTPSHNIKAEGLFSALRKYRARSHSDPLENFVTEAFAWLLKADANLSTHFLRSLKCKHADRVEEFVPATWNTQRNWNGCFPDMVCEIGEAAYVYVFEHKVWSPLHARQLTNYREYADDMYKDRYKLLLITAHRGQHEQNPDESLCWEDVYKMAEEYLQKSRGGSSPIRFLIEDFLTLLRDIGVAPMGVFRLEEIIGYSSDFRYRMNVFWEHVAVELKSRIEAKRTDARFLELTNHVDFHIEKEPDQWGRIGVGFFREWRPGLFAGILLEPEEHCVDYSNPEKGPDLCLIISFHESLHSFYESDRYRRFRRSFEFALEDHNNQWEFHDQLGDPPFDKDKRNLWHPLHIRRPMVEILSGVGDEKTSLQQQAVHVAANLFELLEVIFTESDFLKIRSEKCLVQVQGKL